MMLLCLFMFALHVQSNRYQAVTLGEWLSDCIIQVDRLIQVVRTTGLNTVKMPLLQLMT